MHSLDTPLPLSVANKGRILLVQVCIIITSPHVYCFFQPWMHVKAELGEQRDRIQEIVQLCALYITL